MQDELKIVRAETNQYEEIRAFYHSLIDEMYQRRFHITWKKDINPDPAFLKQAIEKGEFYTGYCGDDIAAGMILNHTHNKEYEQVRWQVPAEDSEINVIHSLGIHPHFTGKGMGMQMVEKAVSTARETGMKAVRLDVLRENEPAKNLYIRYGFQYIDTRKLYYPNTGWADFEMYEYLL